MAIHQWKNHTIDISSHALAKHLWFTIHISIKVDDKELFQSPDKITIKDTVLFKVCDDSKILEGKLVTIPPSSVLRTRYKLFIEDTEIDNGKVTATNWYMLHGLLIIGTLAFFGYVYN